LVGCFAIGIPAVILGVSACKTRPDAKDLWFYAPLVGVGFLILVCQNLFYLDVVVSKSAILVWALAGCRLDLDAVVPFEAEFASPHTMAGPWARHCGLSSPCRRPVVPRSQHYYGYGWIDMLNYVSMAQFIADFPLHSSLSDQAFLVVGQSFRYDRIGQSALHAFLMVSSGSDAQQSFGRTIFLSPLFFGFLTMARRFVPPSPVSCLAALAGALSPTVATIHLECFFS
jgi:hypothetical protein